jgi:hypothetical protein
MPNYIVKPSHYNQNTGCGDAYCKDSAIFFNTLATKLLEMTTSIETRIEEIQKNCNNNSIGNGIYFVQIEVPSMKIGVKYEYIEYVKRYGPPPPLESFDETKLQQIREELGLITDPSLSL